jgi:hypothetical protein
MLRLLVTADIVPNSSILVTLMKEATYSSETSGCLHKPHGVTSQKITFFMLLFLSCMLCHLLVFIDYIGARSVIVMFQNELEDAYYCPKCSKRFSLYPPLELHVQECLDLIP